jgi:hypothetical protein
MIIDYPVTIMQPVQLPEQNIVAIINNSSRYQQRQIESRKLEHEAPPISNMLCPYAI